MGTIGWRRSRITEAEIASSPTAQRAMAHKWAWGGVPGFEFGAGGHLTTPWGVGAWGLVTASQAAEGSVASAKLQQVLACGDCLFADFANANHNLRFTWEPTPTFTSVRVGDLESVQGVTQQ